MVTNDWLCSRSLRGPVGIWTWSFGESPWETQLPFTHPVNETWKKTKHVGADEGDREVGDSFVFSPVHHTHGGQRTRSSIWMTMLEGHHSDRPLACIRCRWVAADQMMSERRLPAQTVLYMALAGPERSSMLVMIIHSQSPHMEISATESVKFHADYDSAWRLDVRVLGILEVILKVGIISEYVTCFLFWSKL